MACGISARKQAAIYSAKVHVANIHASNKIPSVNLKTCLFKMRFENGNAKRKTQSAQRFNASFEATKP